MKHCFVKALILLTVWVLTAQAKPDAAKSGWIDTVAPLVSIQPRDTFQSRIFHCALSQNEEGVLWYCVVPENSAHRKERTMDRYQNPFTIMDEGALSVFYYGEDLAGNKSKIDSMRYVLDTKPPEVSISPLPGKYRSKITVHAIASEPCRLYFYSVRGDTTPKAIADSLIVLDSAMGFIRAIDRAGNIGNTAIFSYSVDSSVITATIVPKEGMYNKPQLLSFSVNGPGDVYVSFDPSAPARWFGKYEKPQLLPLGNTIVRYYTKGANGWESDISQATYSIDTVKPRIHLSHIPGVESDRVVLSTKKMSIIRFTVDGHFPTKESSRYETAIILAHKGKAVVKAIAIDKAGNVSDIVEWSYTFDKNPPVTRLSKQSGLYNAPVNVSIFTDKPASIYYTLDNSAPSVNATLYNKEILISKDGLTKLRFIAIDESGNNSPEVAAEYDIDTKPPEIHIHVEENIKENIFKVTLTTDEDSRIYYEVGDNTPTLSSTVYTGKISMRMGQTLRYFAVDKVGNRSAIKVMDDLKRPMVTSTPQGGIYNRKLKVTLSSGADATMFWRMTPDTLFQPFVDSLMLMKDGVYMLEYYSETPAGIKSPLRTSEYIVDQTPPHVAVTIKKGTKDSISVFFDCTKNATIYYTIDGSNPAYSSTTRTLANKFLLSQDRLSVYRKADVKLAFFAEDIAGNQSSLTVLDVFKPQAVPNVPAGKDILYDRILSIALNTYDTRSQIFYSRHGKTPTTDSTVFSTPINLTGSDTIVAFVIDAAGYRGQLDTFVYLIDLPPSPNLTITPDTIQIGTTVHFDASATIDHETPLVGLFFRYDFDGDGKFDTNFKTDPLASFTYTAPGVYKAVLEVKDKSQRIAKIVKEVMVRCLCPAGMVSIALPGDQTFCMDAYEWPDSVGIKPVVKVSWVIAKMSCLEGGKHLCTPQEWTKACKGPKKTSYPYGNKYEKGRCADNLENVSKSGAFSKCGSELGVFDMTGNVWEWVDGKDGDYPLLKGGSFTYGEDADCNVVSHGSVGTQSGEVGFRCCK